jgi:hypothetical protein
MLAARNQRFRIAAAIGAVAYLITAAAEIVDANRLFGLSGLPGGYGVSAVLFPAAHIIGAGGWVVVATAFGEKLDWSRLRLGAAVVAASLIAYFVALGLQLETLLDIATSSDPTQLILFLVFGTVSALATAAAAVVTVAACADSRRGPTRARWLRAGAGLAALAYLATTVALLFEQDYWSGLEALPSEYKIGAIVAAVGAFGLAVGVGVFARRATEPLGRREAALAAAALIIVAATVCVAAGEALITYGYRDGLGSVLAARWLLVAGRLVTELAVVWLGLGARSVAATAPARARST